MKRSSVFGKVICCMITISLVGILGLEVWMCYWDNVRVYVVEKKFFE